MNFEDHVILYAKNWYGSSGKGIISDLSVLLAEYSSMELQYISKNDIIEFLIRTFVRTTAGNPHNAYEGLKHILIPLFPADSPYHRSPEAVLVGKISIWHPDDTWKSSFPFEDLKKGKGLLPVSFKPKNP